MWLPVMSRRGFFRAFGKTAFVSAGAGPFIQSAVAAIQNPHGPTTQPKQVPEHGLSPLDTYVAGIYYYQANEVRHLLSPADGLGLRRQPDNPYDPAAIEIFTSNGIKLGYVPAAVNQPYAELMDQGSEVLVEITDVGINQYEDILIRLN